VVTAFISDPDPAKKAELLKRYQKLHTENVYTAGLTNYPGALIINKRIRNVASGTPILAFQWAEDGAVRERMYVPADLQENYELHPQTLPGKFGEEPME
jgi:peptide/nickel transport system substrate-binding protein